MTAEETKPPKLVPTTPPIAILQTDAARTLTHLHPALLLAYYLFRFSALVANPTSTLFADLLPVSLLQLAYAVTCLPAHKPAETPQPVTKPPKSGSRKRPAPTPKSHENALSGVIVCQDRSEPTNNCQKPTDV